MSPLAPVYRPIRTAGDDLWEVLGIPERGVELYENLRQGLPYAVFDRLAAMTGLDKKRLAEAAGIPPATLQRRARAGRFSMDESDRLYRVAEVLEAALGLFEGDLAMAQAWLTRPIRGLGERNPLEMLATSAETRAVLDLIGRLEHGVFS